MEASKGGSQEVQIAQTVMPRGLVWALLGITGAIALPVIGEMIFALLGVTPEDPSWGFVLLLGGLWAVVAGRLPVEWHHATGTWPSSVRWMLWLGSATRDRDAQSQSVDSQCSQGISRSLTWASRVAAGALLGFFYGGRWTGNDVRGAMAGLLLGLVLSLYLGLGLARTRPGLERVMGVAIAFCAAYGLWFWLGAWGLAALMAERWLLGFLYSGVALGFCQWAWLGLRWLGFRGYWQNALAKHLN